MFPALNRGLVGLLVVVVVEAGGAQGFGSGLVLSVPGKHSIKIILHVDRSAKIPLFIMYSTNSKQNIIAKNFNEH